MIQKIETIVITISKKEREYERIRFVLRAVSKGNTNPSLNYIHVEDKVMVATDSKRMHIAEDIDIPDGEYRVVKNNSAEIILIEIKEPNKYPNYKAVIPDLKECTEHRIYACSLDNMLAVTLKNLPDDRKVSVDFIKQIKFNMDSVYICKERTAENNWNDKAMVFIGTKVKALIMPMKM